MIDEKSLDLRIRDHVILIMRRYDQEQARRRYIVDRVSPTNVSVIVRAADPYYNPIYIRDQNYHNNMREQHIEEFRFADQYRIKSYYGSVHGKALGLTELENNIRPYIEVTRPVDNIDGTAAGEGRIINYADIVEGKRDNMIGTTFATNRHDPNPARVDVTLSIIDGQLTLLIHPTEGVTPIVRVVER